MKNYILIFLFNFCIYNAVFSQFTDWMFLPKISKYKAFAQEGDFLWAVTNSTIIKMNTMSGQAEYFNKQTCNVSSAFINNIAIDNFGNKWFTSQYDGLIKFDGENWSNFRLPGNGTNSQYIVPIVIDVNNRIWVTKSCMNDVEIDIFDGINWSKFTPLNSGLPDDDIKQLYAENNNIWILGAYSLTKFDGTNWVTYNSSNSNFSINNGHSIEMDSKGVLWIANNQYIESFNGTIFQKYDQTSSGLPFGNPYIESMSIDNNDKIWLGRYGNNNPTCNYPYEDALMSFDGKKWETFGIKDSTIYDDYINSVFVDNSNRVWVGGGHFGKLDCKKDGVWNHFDLSLTKIIGDEIRDIVFDEDNNAIVSNSRFVSYSYSYGSIDLFNWENWNKIHNRFGELYSNENDSVFMLNDNEFYQYNHKNWEKIQCDSLKPNGLRSPSTSVDSLGNFWSVFITTITYSQTYPSYTNPTYYYGLANFKDNKWIRYDSLNSPLLGGLIYKLEHDKSGLLWIATSYGLLNFDGINWKVFNKNNSPIFYNGVQTFVIDSTNSIYIRNPNGLIKYDGINWTTILMSPNILFLGVQDMQLDIDGSIWFNSANSLMSYNGEDWSKFNFKNSPIDSIGEDASTLSIDKLGNKWIGNSNGILVYKEGGVIIPEKKIFPSPNFEANSLINVFPNPSNGSLNISFVTEKDGAISIELLDIMGKIVMKPIYEYHLKGQYSNKIDLINLKSGVYMIRLLNNKDIIALKRIIKSN